MEQSDQDLATSGASGPRASGSDELLTPGEVARMFGVDPKTVSRWSDAGRLDALRTLGGHRRYRVDEVEALLEDAGSN